VKFQYVKWEIWYGYKLLNLSFGYFSKEDFTTFSNLGTDFEDAFPIQEVTTGSAFVIVPLKNIKALERLIIDKDKMNNWMQANCKTSHRALYFLLFRRC
jgi:trans-2,3-dihydro-3-hydroxyanthranilate isomerase